MFSWCAKHAFLAPLENIIKKATFLQSQNTWNSFGFYTIFELSGSQHSGPKTNFSASKKHSVRKVSQMELLK